MISLFLFKKRIISFLFILALFIGSLFYIYNHTSDYAFDIFKLHNELKKYDRKEGAISENILNEWRNLFRHPLTVPIFIDNSPKDNLIDDEEDKNSKRKYINQNKIPIVMRFGVRDVNGGDVLCTAGVVDLVDEFSKFFDCRYLCTYFAFRFVSLGGVSEDDGITFLSDGGFSVIIVIDSELGDGVVLDIRGELCVAHLLLCCVAGFVTAKHPHT